MAQTIIRLVFSQVRPPIAAEKSPPALTIVQGGSEAPIYHAPEPWRWSPAGRLLPRVSRLHRIRLPTGSATKEWRELAKELHAATDKLGQACGDDTDTAWNTWASVAGRVILCAYQTPRALRTKIALASVIAGQPFEHGGMFPPDNCAAAAFVLLDRMAFQWELRMEEAKSTRTTRRKRQLGPSVARRDRETI